VVHNFEPTEHLRRAQKNATQVLDIYDSLEGKPSEAHIWAEFLYRMDQIIETEIQKRNRTTWLLDWLKPGFSTSTATDGIIANALMMTSPTQSSDEMAPLACGIGIPSITLSGGQGDWELLISKLDRMQAFGASPHQYGDNLRPILLRVVATFENPNDDAVRKFWSNVVIAPSEQAECRGNRVSVFTGWINGFHFWGADGEVLSTKEMTPQGQRFALDGTVYPWRHIRDLPSTINKLRLCWGGDNPINADRDLVMGMMVTSIKRGFPEGYEAPMRRANFSLPPSVLKSDHGILQPQSAYFQYDPFPGKVFFFTPTPSAWLA
jgi:hypothetical protein